ncbi:uroporphyrinogen-III synthase [Ursidibacter arcticus]
MNVLVTRPDLRGEKLTELLVEQGLFAIHQPLFMVESGRELPLLPSALARLNSGDYVFAVSKNAVDFATQTLNETGFAWRSDLMYFAVGQSSANYFSAKSEQAVRYPLQSENSEGLLALPEMQQLQDKNILILRANTGREFFTEQAIHRGAKVQTLECYQRIESAENLSEKISLAKRVGVDTIIATSAEILSLLVEKTLETEQEWLFGCRILVVGERLANIAKRLGWQQERIIVSKKADNMTLLETLLTHHQS